jgi:NTP pyrophosphatase (non-canonical NTP hydrolase)
MSYLTPHTHRLDRGKSLAEMTAEIRANNIEKGWRRAEGGPGDNTWGDYLALLHSEVSEALEAYRDHRLEDATAVPGRCCQVGEMCATHDQHFSRCGELPKPEGVGSEFADVLIRLLDMCDVFDVDAFDMDVELADVTPMSPGMADMPTDDGTFGDWMAWLHKQVAETIQDTYVTALLLRAVVTAAEHFGIDLTAEYERKIAYNRTRSFQHGGRTLSGTGA